MVSLVKLVALHHSDWLDDVENCLPLLAGFLGARGRRVHLGHHGHRLRRNQDLWT